MAGVGRRRWILALVAVLVGAVVGSVCLVMYGTPGPAPLGFGQAGYYESKGTVRAWVSVTNLSGANILLFGGHGWARIEGPQGWVTNRLEVPGMMTSVRPGTNFFERLTIVPGTTRWQIGYFVPTQSGREKAKLSKGWRRRALEFLGPILSDKKPPAEEFWSEVFVVPAGVAARGS